MKKTFVIIGLFAVSITCNATPISIEKAKENATRFLTIKSEKRRAVSTSELTLAYSYISIVTDDNVLYVFNWGKQDGFVIASGDDCAEPVLGFSDTGSFNAEKMAPAVKWWLETYQRQIEYASIKGVRRRTSGEDERKEIAPMIETQWNQEAPYNTLCPYDNANGKRCMTGCVATATAQLMYYHKWPERGTGSHSYVWNGETLTADFENTYYQWDKMKTTYYGGGDTDNAVATLMYHCGVALEMNYGTSVSTATALNGEVLSKYFGYSPYYKRYIRDVIGDGAFEAAIYNDLAGGLPVLYLGQDKDRNEGHQFLCDGYRKGGYYHMNWGWGGWNDGYFLLSALNVSDGRKWNWDQEIYCGIKKYEKEAVVDGLRFEDTGNMTAVLTGGQANGNFVVPSSVEIGGQLCQVTSIGKEAFRNNTDITTLVIPASITYIGEMAFRNCSNLRELTLEDNAGYTLTFGNNVFEDCNLEKAYVGRNTANAPLQYKRSLKDVAFGDGVYALNDYELYSTGITSLTIPASVTKIGYAALGDCRNLNNVNVDAANSYYCSEEGVLYDKSKLVLICYPARKDSKEFVCPESITTISEYAFSNAEYLEKITINSNLKKIGERAFSNNGLRSIYALCTTPPSCESNSFEGNVPNNVILYVPKGCLDAYKSAVGWENLKNIQEIEEETDSFRFTINGSTAILTGGDADESLVIPSVVNVNGTDFPVTAINDGAFRDNLKIREVTIPASVVTVGDKAFSGCTYLESLAIEDGQKTLAFGADVFDNCAIKEAYIGREMNGAPLRGMSTLAKVSFGKSVSSVKDYEFFNTGLTDMLIPAQIKSIGYAAFGNCQDMRKFEVEEGNDNYFAESDVLFANTHFSRTGVIYSESKKFLLYYPAQKVETEFICPADVSEIAEYAFAGQEHLEMLTLYPGVTNIGAYAFSNSQLKILNIASSLPPTCQENSFDGLSTGDVTLCVPQWDIDAYKTATGWNAIGKIMSLDDNAGDLIYSITDRYVMLTGCNVSGVVNIPASITLGNVTLAVNYISDNAFRENTKVTQINVPASVISIESKAFYKASQLKEINVDADNRYYASEEGGLYNKEKSTLILLPENSKITEFEVPETVTKIKRMAICGSKVVSIILPADIKEIETDAIFCYRLESLYMKSIYPPAIEENTFSAIILLVANPTLYVPKGSLEAYKNASGWHQFGKIAEMDYSGVAPVVADKDNTSAVYSIGGKLIKKGTKSIDSLPHGVYIVNGRKILVK